ncbi:hypothetical protein Pmob_0645 [Petrotoga mobilis SJ95]|uniref:Uncharacterized protein n=1 Tax=Petrotoga mobilis (strain DSM 10674 / SJ95) TaxID=403833 RepID=A9BJG2_PETMO|nr:hypothetical protein [Petrotoga mobilis]ABX31376.1 hypothetical protein Pmob_0645 [Petrotoga mobilis SJ95]
MGGKWVANKLLNELKSSERISVLLPTHFLKKIVVYAYIVSSNIIEEKEVDSEAKELVELLEKAVLERQLKDKEVT